MKGEQLDSVDKAILSEVRDNCRGSYRDLAKRVGISPVSLIERMRKLEKAGFIRGYAADLDFLKMGYEFMGLVQISIEPGFLIEAQEKISKLKGVYAVYDVTGEHDSTAIVMARNRSEFSALIKKILATPHVRKTNTHTILNVVKDPFSFRGL